jgi:hypothetical protein
VKGVLRPADRLAELAVAHDVDAGLDLLADHGRDRVPEAGLIGVLVDGLAVAHGAQELEQGWRPDQAAHMRGQDPVGTPFHDVTRSSMYRVPARCRRLPR